MDDFEGVFEKKICRFVGAKCHIKLIYAIYMFKHVINITFNPVRADVSESLVWPGGGAQRPPLENQ